MYSNRFRERQVVPGEEIKSGSVDSILAALYQKLIRVMHLSGPQFDKYMNGYLSDPRNCFPNNLRDRSSLRGNLRKELLKVTMTWKVFCKGLRFLKVARFDMQIAFYTTDGKNFVLKQNVVLDSYEPSAFQENATEGEEQYHSLDMASQPLMVNGVLMGPVNEGVPDDVQ